MGRRHSAALAIQLGAVNPSGIANSIVEACREMRDEPEFMGTAQLCADPAIKLMVHQLAYICGVTGGVEEMAKHPKYYDCVQVCDDLTKVVQVPSQADVNAAAEAQERYGDDALEEGLNFERAYGDRSEIS